MPFVGLTLCFGYVFPEEYRPNATVQFFSALLSIIPLAYYIGMAVTSIAVQSTFAIGAVLNATFGSMIELILYCNAIKMGTLDELVQYAVTGSLLSTLLLLPGVSMIVGGLKYKEQRFNTEAASVSSVLLLISIIGAFTPTIYYLAWGSAELICPRCIQSSDADNSMQCSGCVWEQVKLDEDPIYTEGAR